MSKFRPYASDQGFLLPPDLRDWLPDGHLAYFVSDVVDGFDLSSIIANSRVSPTIGRPGHNPAMLLKLTVYYPNGVSRAYVGNAK